VEPAYPARQPDELGWLREALAADAEDCGDDDEI